MRAIELVKLQSNLLKCLSKIGIRMGDWNHVGMYEDYVKLRSSGEKMDYIVAVLTSRYKVSESTLRRVLRRLGAAVTI